MRFSLRIAAALAVLGGVPVSAQTQTVSPAPSAPAPVVRPSISPTRVQQPPTIDGRLDDPAWRTAAHISDFVQRRPLDGAPASELTDVYLAYDRDHLYFGIRAHY